jgi:hypothetical protein
MHLKGGTQLDLVIEKQCRVKTSREEALASFRRGSSGRELIKGWVKSFRRPSRRS